MMIQDEELRSLYQITGLERLQKLQTGLLHLEQDSKNGAVLDGLRQEIHSLKGDSRIIGLGAIAGLTQQIEDIFKAIQRHEVDFTVEVSDRLYQGLQATGQMMHEAATGEPGDVDLDAMTGLLSGVLVPTLPARIEIIADDQFPAGQPTTLYINDPELRDIYLTTSESRLDLLELTLTELSSGLVTAERLETLRRETHSFKGDSKVVGLDALGDLAQSLETAVKVIQEQPALLTPLVCGDLDYGLVAIRQLVHEAVTGDASDIDIEATGAYLLGLVTSADAASNDALPNRKVQPAPSQPVASIIEDDELREIYQTTSEERLQQLESSLLYLEKHPRDEATLAALLRETHSLKGDSRSTGVDGVEAIAHAMEDVLVGVQQHDITLDSGTSDVLYQGLDAMGQLVEAAVMGTPSGVTTDQLLDRLRAIAPSRLSSEPQIEDGLPSAPAEVNRSQLPKQMRREDEGTQTDSIRVQAKELDALLSQTEVLAVSRIQIAQTATQAQQLMALWEEWRAGKHKQTDAIGSAYEERVEAMLLALRSTIQENSSTLEIVSEDLRDRVRKLLLLPISTLFQPLPRLVRDLAQAQSKDIDLILDGDDVTADKRLLEGIKDSVMHLVRNAVDHGIETPAERLAVGKPATATLHLKAHQTAVSLSLEITDDGKGLDLEQIKRTAIKRGLHRAEELEQMSVGQIQRLILAPGFSTRTFITEVSGRGVGLDVLRSQVERLKGGIQIESIPGQGCTFRLQLSTALSTANVVLVEIQGITFAIPIEFLQLSLLVSQQQITSTNGRSSLAVGEDTIPIADLAEVLELSKSPSYRHRAQPIQGGEGRGSTSEDHRRPCILLKIGEERAGFLVDRLITQQEVVSKPLGRLLKRVRNVSGATILGTGDVCMILNPADLVKSLQRTTPFAAPIKPAAQAKPTILLVEDSPPVRIQEKRLFEGAGYEVTTANHGLEGYNILRTGRFDAVVSDVEMPHLDGFSLVARIRQHREYDDLPIVLVTTLDSDADCNRGAEAGASAYIIKGRFNQDALLKTLEQLL